MNITSGDVGLKILLLSTSGTIAYQNLCPATDFMKQVLLQFIAAYKDNNPNSDVEFSLEIMDHISGNDLAISKWKELHDKIKAISKPEYDGVIVTLEVSTLTHIAPLFSFLLNQSDVPIFFISDCQIEDVMFNKQLSFITAVDFIVRIGTAGVFSSVGTEIYLGTRLWMMTYGWMIGGEFERNPDKNNPTVEDVEKKSPIIVDFPDGEKSLGNFIYLTSHVGLNYSHINIEAQDNDPPVVFHELYLSGGACTDPENEEFSILVFAKRCMAQGVEVYAAPYNPLQPHSSAKDMADVGIKLINSISSVAAYTKLLIAYGAFSDAEKRMKFIESNIAYEQWCPMKSN